MATSSSLADSSAARPASRSAVFSLSTHASTAASTEALKQRISTEIEKKFIGARIDLHGLIPLHPDEMKVKLKQGTDALINVLDRGGVTELLEPDRRSYARR